MKYRQFVVCEALEERRLFSAFPLGDNAKFGIVTVLDSRPLRKRDTITQLDSVAGRVNMYVNPAHAHRIFLTFTHASKRGDLLVFRQEGGLVVVIPLAKLSSVNFFGGAESDTIITRGKARFATSTPINFYEGSGHTTIKNATTYSGLYFFSDVSIEDPINPRHIF